MPPHLSIPFTSHRYEHLAPPPQDKNPTYEQPNASNDIDVPRELIGREDLRAHKARPRALVRVDERAVGPAATRQMRGCVVRRPGMGRCSAACHYFAD
jgi:hypothetical protein